MSQLIKRFKTTIKPNRDVDPPEVETNVNDNDPDVATSALEFSGADTNHTLKLFSRSHRWDPNIGDDELAEVTGITTLHDANAEAKLVERIIENSPYPEVRASVRNYDEDVPTNTIRAWVIGMLLTTIGSGLNVLFSLRAPSIVITSMIALLIAYPLGVGWAKIMPSRPFSTFGVQWSLNPCPFSVKEHALIVIMANASFGSGFAYFADTLAAQRAFYGQNFGWGFNAMLAVTTQCVGFGIAGLMRRYLVEPASMIWPPTLVGTVMMYTLHDNSKTDPSITDGWSISRYRFFLFVFLGSFVWYWVPGFIAQFLSVFAVVTWIKPNNVVLNQLFGGWTGISLLPITFDWTQVTGYVFSPLIPPFHAIANVLIGTVLWFWITTTALHYSNHWYGQYLPISDSNSYDNTAQMYNVSKILTPEYTLDLEKYKEYSPIFLSTTFSLAYGLSFGAISGVIVHTIVFYGSEIWIRSKATRGELDDIHTKLMRKYKDAPAWWYLILLAVMVTFSFLTVLLYETRLTWWALIIALLIPFLLTVPIGLVQASTNIQVGLNVFTEFIIGYMLPGRPLAMMLFKTYGYITMTQALSFLQDLKLGHYIKIPPRVTFFGQVIATIWSCFVQLAVLEYGLNHITDVCTSGQPNNFTCPNARVFFNASIIWGVIGPARIFSPGSLYVDLQWFWLAGAIVPVAIYVLARQFPRSKIRFLNGPVIFGGTGMIPPATPLNYLTWSVVGYIFQKYIRNHYRGWWMRFNYLASAGLDMGLAICTIVIIAGMTFTNTKFPSWWGNEAPANTLDYTGKAIQKPLAEGERFGPTSW